jgi:arylsulfatase A-like enzyme
MRDDLRMTNVVAVVLDDTGFGQLGCYGSGIATPHLDALAGGGVRYRRFHVTAMCSPTRASFLTGRNPHAVGMGFLTDLPLNYPGYTGRIPPSAPTLPRVLTEAGYSTLAVGKWHLTPRYERSAAGPFRCWPLGLGFERFYGFLQGDTNQWAPNLVQDNHYIDQPAQPEDGYHLSEDLAGTAIRLLLDQQQAAPGKPFFLYFALGATHAPHHVPPQWSAPYRGQFDHGWDSWRQQVFDRQLAAGVVPPGAQLTPRPDWVSAWDRLSADERRMLARQQEVFAGFLTHTDAQIGRLTGFLRDMNLLDDTLILAFSDNGASAEGGAEGSVNEHRFSARIRESLADNLAGYDDWGGPSTYNHYSWGWAWAGNTPFRLWKRYTWLGGTRVPLIVHWPAGITARGEVRDQFAHVIDLMPTVLDATGIEAPAGDGRSLRATFDDPAAPAARETQYFELLGSRSIVHGNWKATTDHVSTGILDEEELMQGSRTFDDDHWALFDLAADFAEATDVGASHPEMVRDLRSRWDAEAERNQVLPIGDGLMTRLDAMIWPQWPAGDDRTFLPGGGPVCDESVPMLAGGFLFTVDIDAAEEPEGVLFALGDWNAGYALFVAGGLLTFALSRAGEMLEVTAEQPLSPGRQRVGVRYHTGRSDLGVLTVLHGDTAVGELSFAGMVPFTFQHGGAGLRLGHDAGLPVSRRYRPPFRWNGGLSSVRLQTPGPTMTDPRDDLRTAMHAD